MKAWTTVACFLLGMAAVAGAYSAGRARAPVVRQQTVTVAAPASRAVPHACRSMRVVVGTPVARLRSAGCAKAFGRPLPPGAIVVG